MLAVSIPAKLYLPFELRWEAFSSRAALKNPKFESQNSRKMSGELQGKSPRLGIVSAQRGVRCSRLPRQPAPLHPPSRLFSGVSPVTSGAWASALPPPASSAAPLRYSASSSGGGDTCCFHLEIPHQPVINRSLSREGKIDPWPPLLPSVSEVGAAAHGAAAPHACCSAASITAGISWSRQDEQPANGAVS